MSSHRFFPVALGAAALTVLAPVFTTFADETQDAVRALQKEVGDLKTQMKEKDRQLEDLQKKTAAPPVPGTPAALDAALRDLNAPAGGKAPEIPSGKSALDISLDVIFSVGTSSERDDVIQQLQGGAHDPHKRGFTLQQAELSILGNIDPHFRGEMHAIFAIDAEGETVFELEEAFLQSTSLPGNYQFEGGFFFTEFGLINPTHPHAWEWLDQPVIHSRVFGGDGLRQAGFRVSQILPFEHFSEWHAGMQIASGETTQSFLANDEVYDPAEADRSIGGVEFNEQDTRSLADFLYTLRWVNGWDLPDRHSAQVGVSALFGPNASGTNGDTVVYGIDLKVKGPGNGPRGTGWVWQTEWVRRDFDVDAANANFVTGELEDWGLYTQLQCWLNRHWAAGLRYEIAGGSGSNSDPAAPGTSISRDTDPFRADRQRLSPLVTFMPSEYSRLRLQYNYDLSDHLSDPVHSVWFGIEFALGSHPAHGY